MNKSWKKVFFKNNCIKIWQCHFLFLSLQCTNEIGVRAVETTIGEQTPTRGKFCLFRIYINNEKIWQCQKLFVPLQLNHMLLEKVCKDTKKIINIQIYFACLLKKFYLPLYHIRHITYSGRVKALLPMLYNWENRKRLPKLHVGLG